MSKEKEDRILTIYAALAGSANYVLEEKELKELFLEALMAERVFSENIREINK